MNIFLSDIIKQNDDIYLFEDDFDKFLLSADFKRRYGSYVPFCYKFRVIDDVIYYPPLETNFFNSVKTINKVDMLNRNYTPLDIMVKNNKIFVLDGHHRILRFLILSIENKINLNTVNLNYVMESI